MGDLGGGPRARLNVDALPWGEARGPGGRANVAPYPPAPPDRAGANLPATQARQDRSPDQTEPQRWAKITPIGGGEGP